jgi:acyl dehydratase
LSSVAARDSFEMHYGKITDAGLKELRSRIGKPIPAQGWGSPMPVASDEAIRLWSRGIGDDNPLYSNLEYGYQSAWGSMLAPPSIVLGMEPHRLGIMGGLPGVHALYAGVNFRWHDVIREGVRVVADAALRSVDERENSRASGRAVKVITEAHISDAAGPRLVTMEHFVMRHERSEMRDRGSFRGREVEIPYQYTDAEIGEIREQYRAEVKNRRGSASRLWEDVEVGQHLPQLLKGPLTLTSIVAFAMGSRMAHLTVGHRLAFELFDRHPGVAIPNNFNVPEPPSAVHWSESAARFAGLPAPYDFGMERACWAAHLFTDWMGDTGFLRSLNVKFRGPNYVGDLTRFNGRVVEKFRAGGLNLLRCTYEAKNQRDETTTSGEAVVALPDANGSPIETLPLSDDD